MPPRSTQVVIENRAILALFLIAISAITGCGSAAADCWPKLKKKHGGFMYTIDPDFPKPAEVGDARAELRTALQQCAADADFVKDRSHSGKGSEGIQHRITLLDVAILADDIELTEILLARTQADAEARIDPEMLDYGGWHLGIGAFAGSSGVVEWLLASGADPNEPEDSGLTALHASQAWTESGLKVISDLVAYGADIERSVGNGHTPLMAARQHGDLNKVQCLISLGARVPEESELLEARGALTNQGRVRIVDDFLKSVDRSIPKSVADTCYRHSSE